MCYNFFRWLDREIANLNDESVPSGTKKDFDINSIDEDELGKICAPFCYKEELMFRSKAAWSFKQKHYNLPLYRRLEDQIGAADAPAVDDDKLYEPPSSSENNHEYDGRIFKFYIAYE